MPKSSSEICTPRSLELAQRGDELLGVVHDGAFGQFDFEITRFESGLPQHIRDRLGEIVLAKLPQRRRSPRPRTAAMPASCHALFCAQAVRSTHLPIGAIRPISSAIGMKRVGGTISCSDTLPANQRFGTDDTPCAHVDARLIVQLELLTLERAAQLVLQLESLRDQRVQLGGEELEVVATLSPWRDTWPCRHA